MSSDPDESARHYRTADLSALLLGCGNDEEGTAARALEDSLQELGGASPIWRATVRGSKRSSPGMIERVIVVYHQADPTRQRRVATMLGLN